MYFHLFFLKMFLYYTLHLFFIFNFRNINFIKMALFATKRFTKFVCINTFKQEDDVFFIFGNLYCTFVSTNV